MKKIKKFINLLALLTLTLSFSLTGVQAKMIDNNSNQSMHYNQKLYDSLSNFSSFSDTRKQIIREGKTLYSGFKYYKLTTNINRNNKTGEVTVGKKELVEIPENQYLAETASANTVNGMVATTNWISDEFSNSNVYSWIIIGLQITNYYGSIYTDCYGNWSKAPFYTDTDVFGLTWNNVSMVPGSNYCYYQYKLSQSGYPNGKVVYGTVTQIPASGPGIAYKFNIADYNDNPPPGILYGDGDHSVYLSMQGNPSSTSATYADFWVTYAHQQSSWPTLTPSISIPTGGGSIGITSTQYFDYALDYGRVQLQ